MNESQIQRYIDNQIEENLNLDYKSADSLGKSSGKKKEIGKDISAMANSDGGQIIYGISEFNEKDKKHLPEKLDPIDRLEFSKEWLEQIINTNIFPRIQGILIQSVSISSGVNKVVYIVDIPKSDTAHQASDFRYYKRYNFESIPMYDYEVRDIMNRRKSPKIDIKIILELERTEIINKYRTYDVPLITFDNKTKRPKSEPKPKQYREEYRYHVKMVNIGRIVAKVVKLRIKIPKSVLDLESYKFDKDEIIDDVSYKLIGLDNTIQDVVDSESEMGRVKLKYGPKRFNPILPSLEIGKYIHLNNNEDKKGKIFWEIFADDSIVRKGIMNIEEVEIKIIER